MIFSELYSAYYNAVANILKVAIDHPLQRNELHQIVNKYAFGESILNIEAALTEERWQLIKHDGTTPIKHIPSMPLTMLQKRWLKAISMDPRIRLFQDDVIDFPDVKPLFTEEDFFIFDQYADGDCYEDENYRKHFRLILDAIRNQYALSIETVNRRGNVMHVVLMPKYLEYSEKDDKFRLTGSGSHYVRTVNLGRIMDCRPYENSYVSHPVKKTFSMTRTVELELLDSRNALERVLLHFAHFEKQVEKLDNNRYRIMITYDRDDETEMVIRILSFGPMVKVKEPQNFVNLIKQRLIKQKGCGH